MSKAIEEVTVDETVDTTVEETVEEVIERPYTLRKFNDGDLFPILKILKKESRPLNIQKHNDEIFAPCSHKPRFKVFAHLFQKAAQSRARSPCRCPQTAKLLLSFKKGRRGELSCQSNSRGEPTRSEGFSFICAQILYTAQRASTSSASFLGTFPTGEG